ncbi:hypothetical protein [Altericroceibacterium endophyticum]|nr:hypothetical protein [Altericroceibacterium endophyticum]
MTRALLAGCLTLGIAACGDDPAEEGASGTVSGEVLEGTISDAMLPEDKLRSRAPALKVDSSGDASDPASDGSGDDQAEPADDGAAEADSTAEQTSSEADTGEAAD